MSDYFIGLDIGTDSVGWAVTDAQYNIQKRHGKALWGVRLFPEAQKAELRRGFRTSRRRLERRNQRIRWLREIFSAEIAKVDPAFFQRMDESRFLEEDRITDSSGRPLGRYTLFADPNYCDRDYHRDYPTIYHLRRALMEREGPFDVRLVYLAVHHILKKRGHFLFGDLNLEEVSFESCLESLKTCLMDVCDLDLTLADTEGFRKALLNRELNVTRKKAELRRCAEVSRADVQLCATLDLLAGANVRPSALCGRELAPEDDVAFSLRDDFETVEATLSGALGEDMELVHAAKRLYDWALLEELRMSEKYISCAKVRVYEQHAADLARLKALFRADKRVFNAMFRAVDGKLDNYPAYSGHGAANHRCDYDKFSTYARKQIKALLPKLDEAGKVEAESILSSLELGSFLPRQTSKDNGVLPHQLHGQELERILDRAARYLPFLNERDSSGLSRREQICAVFRFRIPYYVGPLNSRSEHSWVVRTPEKIMPWNFDRVVDREASAEKFIERMTAVCSYVGEPVLPRDSLLYGQFVALNAINKLQINGRPISVETKQRIFNEHILAQGRCNLRSLKGYLLSNALMDKDDALTGVDETFRLNLTAAQVFRSLIARGADEAMLEDVIRHIVLFGEDRRLLERWLEARYADALSPEERSYILRNRGRFSGWGNLSREFLTQIEHTDPDTGEVTNLIEALWETNCNLMELLSGQYGFAQSVERYRAEKFGARARTLDEMLRDSYAAPGIRRAIHQTMAIISEIEGLMGGAPRRVFVEVTRREEENKARTTSRKRRLEELYAACKAEVPELWEQLEACDEAALRNTKLYLYYTQMGKCMYSGEPIDLSRLGVDYDIDHIYPQSRVKDDSLDNRVLVKRELNAAKSDSYPLTEDVRARMRPLWMALRMRKLISETKFRRLTRNTPLSDAECADFIARQLVETSQACKLVAELLKRRYKGSDRVVYVKAKNVSDFRQDQRLLPDGTQAQAWACRGVNTRQDPLFVKCREVNDFHHAKDAYLNIVVGNVYHVKFTRNPVRYVRSGQRYSLNRMFDFDVIRDGECAWKRGADGTIATVRKTMRKNNILFTRFSREVSGALFKQQLKPKGKGQAMIKRSDPRLTVENYGGYNNVTGAYFMLVEHTEKKKRVRSIETVFLMHKALYERDPEGYCAQILHLTKPRILIPRIKIDALFSLDGFRMHVSGRTGDRILYKNANELVISPEQAQYIKQLAKFVKRCDAARQNLAPTAHDGVTPEANAEIYALLLDKLRTNTYRVKYETAAKTIAEHQATFAGLEAADQGRVLLQILNLFRANILSADLKLLCGKMGIGIVLTSKYLRNFKGHRFTLIHQSVTGVFEREIDLLGDSF